MANTRTDVIRLARAQIGQTERPAGSNRTKYGDWYGFNGVPWCAIVLSWILAHVGNRSGYRFASTAASVAWARRVGRLRPLSEARPGDVMVKLYTRTTGHTGMCVAPEGRTMVTDEGNTSGGNDRDGGSFQERRRLTSFWDYCIRIDYEDDGAVPPPPPAASGRRCGEAHPLLKAGSKGRAVNHLQYLLIRGGHPISGDGEFGPATRAAVVNFQANQAHIGADGEVGNETWTHLHRHIDGLAI